MIRPITGSGFRPLTFDPLMIWAQAATPTSASNFDQSDVAILIGMCVVSVLLIFIGVLLLLWYWKIIEILRTLKEISGKLNKPY